MVNKNLILDVNVILDLWLGRPGAATMEALVDQACALGARLWVSAASLPTLDYLARRALKQAGMPPEDADHAAKGAMASLLHRAGTLTNHGYDQADVYHQARDFEDAQIAASSAVLVGGETRIVTRDVRFDALEFAAAATPQQALDWLVDPNAEAERATSIDFIDLKTQQDQLRPTLERNIQRVLRHGKYIMGPEIGELEERLAEFTGSQHCISVASGTDALLIALLALEVGPGDEVITTPFSFIATAEVIQLIGAKPVFVDINPRTYNLDPAELEGAITPKTRAIMPVNLYGQCADFDVINAIADRHGLPVIEDAAQSFGATYKGRQSCALSTIGCTSFFPSKPLGGYGDSGACFIDDAALAQRMRQIRVHGQDRRYHHPLIGVNGRMDTLQAAILLPKLEVFPDEVRRRQEAGQRYTDLILGSILGEETNGGADVRQPCGDSGRTTAEPPYIEPDRTSVYAQYTLRVQQRDAVKAALQENGIPTAVHYPVPLYRQPAFTDLKLNAVDFPEAERASEQVFSLPMHPYLREAEQTCVVEALVNVTARTAPPSA